MEINSIVQVLLVIALVIVGLPALSCLVEGLRPCGYRYLRISVPGFPLRTWQGNHGCAKGDLALPLARGPFRWPGCRRR